MDLDWLIRFQVSAWLERPICGFEGTDIKHSFTKTSQSKSIHTAFVDLFPFVWLYLYSYGALRVIKINSISCTAGIRKGCLNLRLKSFAPNLPVLGPNFAAADIFPHACMRVLILGAVFTNFAAI